FLHAQRHRSAGGGRHSAAASLRLRVLGSAVGLPYCAAGPPQLRKRLLDGRDLRAEVSYGGFGTGTCEFTKALWAEVAGLSGHSSSLERLCRLYQLCRLSYICV